MAAFLDPTLTQTMGFLDLAPRSFLQETAILQTQRNVFLLNQVIFFSRPIMILTRVEVLLTQRNILLLDSERLGI